jgi:hypothetical protein
LVQAPPNAMLTFNITRKLRKKDSQVMIERLFILQAFFMTVNFKRLFLETENETLAKVNRQSR